MQLDRRCAQHRQDRKGGDGGTCLGSVSVNGVRDVNYNLSNMALSYSEFLYLFLKKTQLKSESGQTSAQCFHLLLCSEGHQPPEAPALEDQPQARALPRSQPVVPNTV